MNPPPAQSLAARLSPAAMMRLGTIFLVLMLGVLAMLAAHHAQTAQGETSHAILAEAHAATQPLVESGGAAEISSGHLVSGLATGCIVLIACCALGLVLLAARAWRADLFRRLSAGAKPLRARICATAAALTSAARPNLVALSISRT